MTVDHINRYVSNVEAMLIFYTDALGFKVLDRGIKADGKNYAILNGAGIELFISEKDDFAFDPEANLRHLGFTVDDAGVKLRSLKEKGYVPKDTQLIIKAYSRQFYMKDPDGFTLDFIQWTDKMGFYRQLARG